MKINIWIKEDDIEVANTLIESKGIGPFLKKKYKSFEFYNREPGMLVMGNGGRAIQLLINFDDFIQLRDNFECV